MNKIPLIIDTDIGSDIDDTWALAAVFGDAAFDVRLVSTVWEDVHYKCALVRKLAAAAGRSVPVVAGAATPVQCSAQRAWLEGPVPAAPLDLEAAWERAAGEGPVTVLALGPMTNIARVLRARPQLAGKLRIVAMIGAVYKGYINEDAPAAECNAALDPAAFRAVLQSGVPVTCAPLDVCRDYIVDGQDFAALRASRAPLARAVLENYAVWHRDYRGGAIKYPQETSSGILYDLLPVFYLKFPQAFCGRRLKLAVTDDGRTPVSEGGQEAYCLLSYEGRAAFTRYLTESLTGGLHGE